MNIDVVSIRSAAVLARNALHACAVPSGAEVQVGDAMRALEAALRADDGPRADRELLHGLARYLPPAIQRLQSPEDTLVAHNLRLCLIEIKKALCGERDEALAVGVGFPLAAPAVTAEPVRIDGVKIEAAIDSYIEDYELMVEDDEGREGHHTPTELERMLIKDCVMGILADDDFLAAFGHPIP